MAATYSLAPHRKNRSPDLFSCEGAVKRTANETEGSSNYKNQTPENE
jgi:hypothetical protein